MENRKDPLKRRAGRAQAIFAFCTWFPDVIPWITHCSSLPSHIMLSSQCLLYLTSGWLWCADGCSPHISLPCSPRWHQGKSRGEGRGLDCNTSCTPATSCISRCPATSHLEHHQPHAEELLHLLLVVANPAFLHDGFFSPPGVHPSCGCSFNSFDSCGQACREETLPTAFLGGIPWQKHSRPGLCPLGHLG